MGQRKRAYEAMVLAVMKDSELAYSIEGSVGVDNFALLALV